MEMSLAKDRALGRDYEECGPLALPLRTGFLFHKIVLYLFRFLVKVYYLITNTEKRH